MLFECNYDLHCLNWFLMRLKYPISCEEGNTILIFVLPACQSWEVEFFVRVSNKGVSKKTREVKCGSHDH